MDEKPTVYVETSIVSYLVARPSQDSIVGFRQAVTERWWKACRPNYRIVISPRVVDEASLGDANEAGKRLAVLGDLDILEIDDAALELSRVILAETSMPASAEPDALHIATAVVNGVEYLLTWNHKHMANVQIRAKVEQICQREGFHRITICTPEELDPEE